MGATTETVGRIGNRMTLIDMDMPQSCQECPAFATKACDKWDKHKTFSDQRTKRHNDCPLHESNAIEVLQEIRQEIEKTVSRYAISRERGTMGQVEWSDRLIKESDVFGIIDKHIAQYKEDAECTEKSEK